MEHDYIKIETKYIKSLFVKFLGKITEKNVNVKLRIALLKKENMNGNT